MAGADVEKTTPLELKGKADQRKAAGGAVGAMAHAAGSKTNPTPTSVGMDVHVAVQVALARPQSDLAKVAPQLFNTWDKLLQDWGRLEGHLGQVFKADQLQEEWREHLRAFRPVMSNLSNAADKFAGMLNNKTEDGTKLNQVLTALHQLMDGITIIMTDTVHLQAAYARTDEKTIREEKKQTQSVFKLLAHLETIEDHVSGSKTLDDAFKEFGKLIVQTSSWLSEGGDIVTKEKEWVEEAVKSKQDLGGDAGDTALSLEKWIRSTVEKEARLKGELQSAVQGQAPVGGSAALLQQSAKDPEMDKAAAAAPAYGHGSDLPPSISASGSGRRQRGKTCAREGAASVLPGAGGTVRVGVGDLAKAAVRA